MKAFILGPRLNCAAGSFVMRRLDAPWLARPELNRRSLTGGFVGVTTVLAAGVASVTGVVPGTASL